MSKGGVIVLIIAAMVFCGLGFVIGQVVQAAGNNSAGSEEDPVATQSYVNKAVSDQITSLQEQVEMLEAALDAAGIDIPITGGELDDPDTGNSEDGANVTRHVRTTDAVNVRSTASTSGSVLTTPASGTEMVYLDSVSSGSDTWYKVRLADGTEGYVHSNYCSNPY